LSAGPREHKSEQQEAQGPAKIRAAGNSFGHADGFWIHSNFGDRLFAANKDSTYFEFPVSDAAKNSLDAG